MASSAPSNSVLAIASTAFLPPVGSVACQPLSSDQPWPYRFQTGDVAWAKGGNGKWRRATLLDDGSVDNYDGCIVPVFSARWRNDGLSIRGTFSPLAGDIKPDTEVIRRLLRDEEVVIQGEEDQIYLRTSDIDSWGDETTQRLSKL
ncbi:hypothetical protein BV22DRAFT_1130704 [Leucogyrophana mollusca]|uniref:Uncharacterized protein n=1 Tax=Leucogyrophana mollusca TaxID=85980 RepID=A0ACB8BEW1_9AGAM|nr:hypothetical protein BV22DRAFT_1130704 [Leucogyrophana mollusca]